ncbi:hypothetical protein GCM10010341_77600 [Streptomyces noursei]|nr:hypothetical protein GCM10010341_77600 [Streptomyces noursei]
MGDYINRILKSATKSWHDDQETVACDRCCTPLQFTGRERQSIVEVRSHCPKCTGGVDLHPPQRE